MRGDGRECEDEPAGDDADVCQPGQCQQPQFAEVYTTLTGMPCKRRVGGDEALLFPGDIRERLTLIALDTLEYCQVAEASAAGGFPSGAIYDAILGHCALKAKAKVISTGNTKEFLRLSPAIADRVKNPENA